MESLRRLRRGRRGSRCAIALPETFDVGGIDAEDAAMLCGHQVAAANGATDRPFADAENGGSVAGRKGPSVRSTGHAWCHVVRCPPFHGRNRMGDRGRTRNTPAKFAALLQIRLARLLDDLGFSGDLVPD